jgi:hypothetical protein
MGVATNNIESNPHTQKLHLCSKKKNPKISIPKKHHGNIKYKKAKIISPNPE